MIIHELCCRKLHTYASMYPYVSVNRWQYIYLDLGRYKYWLAKHCRPSPLRTCEKTIGAPVERSHKKNWTSEMIYPSTWATVARLKMGIARRQRGRQRLCERFLSHSFFSVRTPVIVTAIGRREREKNKCVPDTSRPEAGAYWCVCMGCKPDRQHPSRRIITRVGWSLLVRTRAKLSGWTHMVERVSTSTRHLVHQLMLYVQM